MKNDKKLQKRIDIDELAQITDTKFHRHEEAWDQSWCQVLSQF